MGLTRSQLEFMLWTTLILSLMVAIVAAGAVWQANGYKDAMKSNCEQYEIIPEKYLEKVPTGCVPQWFEANKK